MDSLKLKVSPEKIAIISTVNRKFLFLRYSSSLKCVKLTSSGSKSSLCAKVLSSETSLHSRLTVCNYIAY